MRFYFFISVIICAFIYMYFFAPYDSTDNAFTGTRSGMSLYIDNKTGCQYLSKYYGGLTPRMDASGKQICEGGK